MSKIFFLQFLLAMSKIFFLSQYFSFFFSFNIKCFKPNSIYNLKAHNITDQFNLDVLDLEAQNDCPDETENEARVAIDNVFSTNTL